MIFARCNETEGILYASIESDLRIESEEDQKFILSNQMVVSDKWIFCGENMGYVKEIIWCKTKTKADIEHALWNYNSLDVSFFLMA
ncbi:hypothetical protein CHH60_13190 [Paenibacillus sp. 7523-1]|nr:hypothetical protein CHH60_13190 [Paenibacillus sp. 7523-1]